MGNNKSRSKEFLAKIKLEEGEKNSPDIYKIVDPKGGGQLIDLALISYQTRNISHVDNFIRQEVSKYLLNDGDGEMVWSRLIWLAVILVWFHINLSFNLVKVPIEQIIYHRNKDAAGTTGLVDKKPPKKGTGGANTRGINESNSMFNRGSISVSVRDEKREYKTMLVCFDLTKRGRNGETLLHLCFYNGTYLHMMVAKRMVSIFPKMLNDICIGDERYGNISLLLSIDCFRQ